VSAPAVNKDMAEHFTVNNSSAFAIGCWSKSDRKDGSLTPSAIWCLTKAYGLSVSSDNVDPHKRPICLNPAPGNESGKCLTNLDVNA
jgi:hypothetical protein